MSHILVKYIRKDFEFIELVDLHCFLIVLTWSKFVDVRVILEKSDSILFNVLECMRLFPAKAAQVRYERAVNQLLF